MSDFDERRTCAFNLEDNIEYAAAVRWNAEVQVIAQLCDFFQCGILFVFDVFQLWYENVCDPLLRL